MFTQLLTKQHIHKNNPTDRQRWTNEMTQVNKISVLQKMIGFGKKKAGLSYVVPQNSTANFDKRPEFKEHIANLKENNYDRSVMNKCPHCENMAKNFLYLESLIRNNCDKNQKCNLCQSSLKYLQYVNRNIMQVFGNFDSIVQAARVFSSQVPPSPKYSVKKPLPKEPQRVEGGAVIGASKSAKLLKTLKSHKSKKSLKSIKSSKSVKNLSKSKSKSKTGTKNRHGKMILKSKYKSKAGKSSIKLAKQLSNVVRSASQYQNLRTVRSKLAPKSNRPRKQRKIRPLPQPTSINWNLLKRNMPKRMKPISVN